MHLALATVTRRRDPVNTLDPVTFVTFQATL
jgi:hypothetical protein